MNIELMKKIIWLMERRLPVSQIRYQSRMIIAMDRSYVDLLGGCAELPRNIDRDYANRKRKEASRMAWNRVVDNALKEAEVNHEY